MSTVTTEAYLQHQAIQATVQRLAQTAAEALLGPSQGSTSITVSRIQRTDDNTWTGRYDISVHGFGAWGEWTIDFEGESYVDGGVKVSHCNPPQTSPSKTTGDYDLLDNRDDGEPIDRELTINETTSTETQTTLSEGVELKSGQSAEAGYGPAKFAASFEQTFSITKDSMNDKSSSKSVEDKISQTVPPRTAMGIVHTAQDSISECLVEIGAAIDWTKITFTASNPDGSKQHWSHLSGRHPGWYPNLPKLFAQPRAVRTSGGWRENVHIECTNLEDWASWMQGRNPRQTAELSFGSWSRDAIDWLAGKNNRVQFSGKQEHSSKVSSYVVHEIPGSLGLDAAKELMAKPGSDPDKLF